MILSKGMACMCVGICDVVTERGDTAVFACRLKIYA